MVAKVITLCGSTKFESDFKEWNRRLGLAGHMVFSLAAYPSDCGGKDWYTAAQKIALDVGYLNKIRRSDAVVVLNRGGYIGESTTREVEFARTNGVPVYYLEGIPNAEELLNG
jgi:hypothetical protein